MDGVLQVVGRPGQDLEDAVQGRVRLHPVEADGQSAVIPRNGVRNVSLGGDPVKDRPPGVPSRQRPEGGEDAVDAGVTAVPLVR